MIDAKLKNQAIAQLKHKVPPELVAEALDIPPALVKEWAKGMSDTDLVAMEANAQAIERIARGEVVGVDDDTLRRAIEDAALAVVKEAPSFAKHGDVIGAKAIQLLLDGLSKTYLSVVLKGVPAAGQGGGAPSQSQLVTFKD